MCGGVQLRTIFWYLFQVLYYGLCISSAILQTLQTLQWRWLLPCCDALFFACIAVVCCIVRDFQCCAVVNAVLYLQWRCCGQAFIFLYTECNVVVCIVLYSAAVCNDVPWYAETLVELESQ